MHLIIFLNIALFFWCDYFWLFVCALLCLLLFDAHNIRLFYIVSNYLTLKARTKTETAGLEIKIKNKNRKPGTKTDDSKA